MDVLRGGVSMTAAQLSWEAWGVGKGGLSEGQRRNVNEIGKTTNAVAWWP